MQEFSLNKLHKIVFKKSIVLLYSNSMDNKTNTVVYLFSRIFHYPCFVEVYLATLEE